MIYGDDVAYVHEAGFGDYARKAAPEIARILGKRLPRPRADGPPLVVEFGCGGGTVAAHLAGRAFRVLGIDQSRAMVRMARAAVPAARFEVGALATARIPRCHAVVAIGEVVNYVMQRSAGVDVARHERGVRRFFERAARALGPGGVLIFDFMASAEGRTYPAGTRGGPDWTIVARAARRGRIVTRQLITFRKASRTSGTYRRGRETHRVCLLSRQFVTAALRRAGFSVRIGRSIGRVRLIRGDYVAIAAVR